MAKLKEALLPGLTQSRVRHREQHLTGRHARWQRLLSGTGSQDGQLQGLPKVQGDTALPLAILVGGNIQLPLNYEYNMLLGIILFSIKKSPCSSSEPRDGCWWLEGPAPHWFMYSSAQVSSQLSLGNKTSDSC